MRMRTEALGDLMGGGGTCSGRGGSAERLEDLPRDTRTLGKEEDLMKNHEGTVRDKRT